MDETVRCHYHPRAPARWCCPGCNRQMCARCAESGGEGGSDPLAGPPCPLCGRQTESVGHANTITPFWLRLHDFFRYPSHPRALIYIGVLALLITLVRELPGIVAAGVQLTIVLVFVRYACATLLHTAQGHIEPPVVDYDMVTQRLGMAFRQMAVVLVMLIGLMLVFDTLGAVAGIAASLFVMLALPAAFILLVMEDSVPVAVNPFRQGVLIARIGWPYLLLYFFLVVLSGGSAVVTNMLVDVLPGAALVFLSAFSSMYFTLIMFTLMGYVVYQYHEALGFAVEQEHEDDEPDSLPPDPAATRSHVLVCEGRVKEALDVLSARLRDGGDDDALRDRFHRLLVLAGDRPRLAAHAQRHIPRLVAEQKVGKALAVYRDCLQVDPDFALEDPGAVLPLARAAKNSGAFDLVLALTRGFRNRHPKHADVPEVYFLAAQVLSEGYRDDARARDLLHNLIRHYPNHQQIEGMRNYRQMLERVQTAPGKDAATATDQQPRRQAGGRVHKG